MTVSCMVWYITQDPQYLLYGEEGEPSVKIALSTHSSWVLIYGTLYSKSFIYSEGKPELIGSPRPG